MRELSLRPYNGTLFIAKSRRDFQISYKKLFKESIVLYCYQYGMTSSRCDKNGEWTYLIWASSTETLVHEISHVVLHVFDRCGIDPREANGEPFCYMLSQLLIDADN